MTREVRVVGIKRKEIDEEKLALAFLLLAKSLNAQRPAVDTAQAINKEPEAA